MTEQEYREHVYKLAEKIKTKKELEKFIASITAKKDHDYGTIVIGAAAAMRGTFTYINNTPKGGLTGFQASCVFWELVEFLTMFRVPMRLVDFNNMLYPQYAENFEKTISQSTWDHLQSKAKERLAAVDAKVASPDVINHWQSIVDGQVPFGYTVKDVV